MLAINDWIKLKKYIASIVLPLLLLTLSSCATPSQVASEPPVSAGEEVEVSSNQDPTKGWVEVVDDEEGPLRDTIVYKRCDGMTLIYVTPGSHTGGNGIAVIDSSVECSK